MRVQVVGNSGSGKTTFATRLAAALDVPHVEVDALHHLPDWQERPDAELRERYLAATAGAGWVACGNYWAVWRRVRSAAEADALLQDLAAAGSA